MMDKLASDAYSQGAYQALQQMNVSGHIKQAAAQHLTKEASKLTQAKDILMSAGSRVGDAFKMKNVRSAIDAVKNRGDVSRLEALGGLKGRAAKDLAIATSLGGAGIGAGAYGLGAFDEDEGLTNAQIAGLAALGVGGAGLAAHQAGLLG